MYYAIILHEDGAGVLLMNLFIPFYPLFYFVTHFDSLIKAFALCFICTLAVVGASRRMPNERVMFTTDNNSVPTRPTPPNPNAPSSNPANPTGPANVAPKHDPVIDAPKPNPTPNRGYDPNFLNNAALQAWFGQDKELADTCERTLTFQNESKDPAMLDRVAKICSLRPLDARIHEAALVLARRAVEFGNKNARFMSYFQMALGMAEYRSGNYTAADAALLEASKLGKDIYSVSCTSAFYRAMSLFRQGKEVEAQKLAAEAIAKMKPLPVDEKRPLVGGANADDLILWTAYKEVKEMLKLTR
jgi:hypothetical protein